MCADFVCLHVPKIQSAQKENPQAASSSLPCGLSLMSTTKSPKKTKMEARKSLPNKWKNIIPTKKTPTNFQGFRGVVSCSSVLVICGSEDFHMASQSRFFHQTTLPKGPVFVASTVCFPWCRAMAEGLRALCAQCQKPLCGPILASGCNHVCLGIGGTGGPILPLQGSNLQLLLLSNLEGRYTWGFTRHVLWSVQAATDVERPCVNPWDTWREKFGSCSWELDSQTHYSIYSLLILCFCLGIFVGVDPNSGRKKTDSWI